MSVTLEAFRLPNLTGEGRPIKDSRNIEMALSRAYRNTGALIFYKALGYMGAYFQIQNPDVGQLLGLL